MVDKQNNHISITTISDQENWQKISICLKDRKLYETLSVALDALVKTKGKGPSASCKLAATSLLVRCFSNETCRGHKKICSLKQQEEVARGKPKTAKKHQTQQTQNSCCHKNKSVNCEINSISSNIIIRFSCLYMGSAKGKGVPTEKLKAQNPKTSKSGVSLMVNRSPSLKKKK